MLLRQVQARPLQGHRLRQVRRRGGTLEGAPRAHGAHRAGFARQSHLVREGHAEPHRTPARHLAALAGARPLLRAVHRHVRGRAREEARPRAPAGGDGARGGAPREAVRGPGRRVAAAARRRGEGDRAGPHGQTRAARRGAAGADRRDHAAGRRIPGGAEGTRRQIRAQGLPPGRRADRRARHRDRGQHRQGPEEGGPGARGGARGDVRQAARRHRPHGGRQRRPEAQGDPRRVEAAPGARRRRARSRLRRVPGPHPGAGGTGRPGRERQDGAPDRGALQGDAGALRQRLRGGHGRRGDPQDPRARRRREAAREDADRNPLDLRPAAQEGHQAAQGGRVAAPLRQPPVVDGVHRAARHAAGAAADGSARRRTVRDE